MNPWAQLRNFTQARVGLGRAGSSLPTDELLAFQLAHARARDAVHASFDIPALERALHGSGWECIRVRSAARGRREYLSRPDLGRRLKPEDFSKLLAITRDRAPFDLLIVIADGLSALAGERHALPLLTALQPKLLEWRVSPIVIAEQARVALGDEIGECLRARLAVVLIGERPGLSAPDSLGAYLTYNPRIGCSDAQRNCLSNIRPGGLSYSLAAHRLFYLLEAARRRAISGVELKDESADPPAILTGSATGSLPL